jgi:Mg-chelatase subunit ChlD
MQYRPSIVVGGVCHLVALALVAATAACSADKADDDGDTGGGARPAQGGSNGHSGQQGSTGGLRIDVGGSTGAQEPDGGEVCNAETHQGERVPVDMYFLVDSSGSMAEDVLGGSKWDVVSQALISFLNDPRNVGTGVGIGYFPTAPPATCTVGQAGCLCIPIINLCFPDTGGSCTVADYATPAVPLVLPPDLAPVIADINAHQVSGGTPTRPALEGALEYLNQWADTHPERRPVLVLATDGEPSGCDSNTPQDIADVAASALSGPHAIQTFVIGVGSSLVSLNLVAQAGGTGEAFLVDTGGDVTQAFSDALEQIRGAAASCDFAIPAQNEAGKRVDPTKVNVRYTATGASTASLVSQVSMNDANNCDAAGGWYYDNPSAPTLIRLCDSTCQSLSGGSIQVEFGCDTIVQPPK